MEATTITTIEQALKDKILAATKDTRLGAVLQCAMDPAGPRPYPCFIGKATITSDGYVMCDFFDGDGQLRLGAFVGAAESLERNVGALGAHLGLDEAQKAQLFALAKSWIGKDYRSEKSRG